MSRKENHPLLRPGPSRRRLLLGGAGAGFLSATGGCVPFGDDEWEVTEDDPLKVYSGRDDSTGGQRRLLIEAWNAEHPKYTAQLIELPGVADLQYSAMHAALQSEDPGVDIVNLDLPWIAEFAKQGYLHRLEEAEDSGFIDRPFAAGRVDGDVYALPFNADVGMLYYRELFVSPDQIGSITGWDSLRSVIADVLDGQGEFLGEGDAPFEAGIAMQLASYEGFTVNVWEYLLANGIDADPEDGSIDFGPGSDAVVLLEELSGSLESRDGRVPDILPASLQCQEDASLAAFQEGRTPFLRHWPRAFRQLQNCDQGFQVGVVPMPGGVLGGQSLAISEFSERKHTARALIDFLTSGSSQQQLFDSGGFASVRTESYYDSIAFIEDYQRRHGNDLPANQICTDGADDVPRLEAEQLLRALEGDERLGTPGIRPEYERYTGFSKAFQAALHGPLANGARPDLDGLGAALGAAIEGKVADE
ncbi:extracellular solute-binding protein [Glycomyces buryatensis]|uniref:Extracellular solute-binding protein n=1 Tax=Glycomyces buryatensis TaxID=2570927 RepID=A0A4S8Q5N9_9ACTN|nr:extracellular solute-binding protein [Glycomyces buryatensis]THV39468.1 extracellular solute-binding protein [Glycomyces buryatensis]